MKAFDIDNVGSVDLGDISLTTLKFIYEVMVMEPERMFKLKSFLRTKLKPAHKLLFDLVHRFFLSQTGTCEQVTTCKFRIIAAVQLNLPFNLPHILLIQIKEEMNMFND